MTHGMAPGEIVLTREQRRAIRQTCEILREQAGPVALLFYGRLFELDPSTRRLFHNDLAVQGRKLMETLDAVTGSLDRFDEMRPRLAELGRKHAGYGVVPSQYEVVTRALLWAIGQALGPDFDPPTREAWQVMLAALRKAMLAGSEA